MPDASWFEAYHSYEDHLTFLSDLQKAFPDNSEIFTAGKSFEDRELTGIHLWGSEGKGSKPAINFHGTVHAREWITTMVRDGLSRRDNWSWGLTPALGERVHRLAARHRLLQ